MASLIDSNGNFCGNSPSNVIPPIGYRLINADFPEGMYNPYWDETKWVERDKPTEIVVPPQRSQAWLELINSYTYQKIYVLAKQHELISLDISILSTTYQSFNLLTDDHWSSSLSAACQRLLDNMKTLGIYLTQEDMDWIDSWNLRHSLGLIIIW
jgi:hypothetical protein